MHGDLKPANCLLRSVPAYTDRRGVTVKLADFGLSRLLNPVSCKRAMRLQGAPVSYNRVVEKLADFGLSRLLNPVSFQGGN